MDTLHYVHFISMEGKLHWKDLASSWIISLGGVRSKWNRAVEHWCFVKTAKKTTCTPDYLQQQKFKTGTWKWWANTENLLCASPILKNEPESMWTCATSRFFVVGTISQKKNFIFQSKPRFQKENSIRHPESSSVLGERPLEGISLGHHC